MAGKLTFIMIKTAFKYTSTDKKYS